MRRDGLLDRKGCKQWPFPDDRMSVPIMTCAPMATCSWPACVHSHVRTFQVQSCT
jgi:hypothetical protein